jgi:uncharacterized DUF497 family protein
MVYDWNDEKNELLIEERGISFEEIVAYIEAGNLIDTIEHPNPKKYPGQRVHVVCANNYVYLVPFVSNKESLFLKTIIPSRKFTKKFLGENNG